MSGSQVPVLLLDVSTTQEPELHLDVSGQQEPLLLLDFPHYRTVKSGHNVEAGGRAHLMRSMCGLD